MVRVVCFSSKQADVNLKQNQMYFCQISPLSNKFGWDNNVVTLFRNTIRC